MYFVAILIGKADANVCPKIINTPPSGLHFIIYKKIFQQGNVFAIEARPLVSSIHGLSSSTHVSFRQLLFGAGLGVNLLLSQHVHLLDTQSSSSMK